MAEFKYEFKTVNDQTKISGSKIFNIIDGPSQIKEGIKNGVPYYEEVELDDLPKEE